VGRGTRDIRRREADRRQFGATGEDVLEVGVEEEHGAVGEVLDERSISALALSQCPFPLDP
jgi:hypothetical protein